MRQRGDTPAAVKVEWSSREDKVSTLRLKQKLKEQSDYKNVFLKSAKSHAERLIEINFKTMLREMPQGKTISSQWKAGSKNETAQQHGGEEAEWREERASGDPRKGERRRNTEDLWLWQVLKSHVKQVHFAHWNVNGWTDSNHNLRETILQSLDADIISLNETHWWGEGIIDMTKIVHVTHFNELLLQIWSECHEIWCEHSSDLWHENLLKSFWSD